MIQHADLGDNPFSRNRQLVKLINAGEVQLGGNRKLHIYGTLKCRSGKRMKVVNRVFFKSADEAEQYGYRPCGHCMRAEYLQWKSCHII
jgi:hypothetical protein